MTFLDRQAILDAIHQLPAQEQWDFAAEILRTAPRCEPPAAPAPRQGEATSGRGISRTEEPLDEARLLEERRMERYCR